MPLEFLNRVPPIQALDLPALESLAIVMERKVSNQYASFFSIFISLLCII
jgi:hypothetical protein